MNASPSPQVQITVEHQVMARQLRDIAPMFEMIEGELMRRSFYEFMKGAWSILEPGSKFQGNWHIGALSEHLEAVTAGQIKRLIINIPPRFAKSTSTSVIWPAWSWTRRPELRFLTASFSRELATRDAVTSRRLMESPWYQQRFGTWFKFTSDQNVKTRYENNKRGYRIATSVEAGATGDGGDVRVIDDPISAQDASSSAARQMVINWWKETFSTRGNNPDKDAVVLVMQRFATDDLTGYLLEQGGWEHLCFPMRYDPDSKMSRTTVLGFTDPRTKKGELLFPSRFDEASVAMLEKDLGSFGVQGQLQQDPVPREGNLYKVDKIKVVDTIPSRIVASVRYWDKAASDEGNGARTAGVLMHRLENGAYVVAHVTKGRWSVGVREDKIKAQALLDGVSVHVYVEQEPGSGGKESAQATIKNLAGYIAYADLPGSVGSKEVRGEPLAAQMEADNVYMLRSVEWNQEFIDELRPFPNGKLKDQADAAAGAFNKVASVNTQVSPNLSALGDDLDKESHYRGQA